MREQTCWRGWLPIAVATAILVGSGGQVAGADEYVRGRERRSDLTRKLVGAGTLAGVHAAYAAWSYFAWYRDSAGHELRWGREPWFDVDEYSGGADKLGHFWANYALTRGSTELLVHAGWGRIGSSLVGGALTAFSFTLTEIEDGYAAYGGSTDDIIANLAGVALGVAMSNVRSLDRVLDFRLDYIPSRQYRRNFWRSGDLDVAQDYSGQSYVIALHARAISPLAETTWGSWIPFVDLAIGFETRRYLPVPETTTGRAYQRLYVGLAMNMQGLLSRLFADSRARRTATGFFEVVGLPLTTFRYAEGTKQSRLYPP
jgi:hypothetical protein